MNDETDLIVQAEAALARRDLSTALALLDQAEAIAGPSPRSRLARANALRNSGDRRGALAALDDVLAAEPYHFMALLTKAVVLEQATQGGLLPGEPDSASDPENGVEKPRLDKPKP